MRLWLVAFVLISAALFAPASASGATRWVAGQKCCPGCSYNNNANCCCAVQAGVVTKTAFPKTVTKTVTIKRGYRNAKVSRRDIDIEPEISAVDSSNRLINLDPRQDRHLCPACPAGVQVGKRIGSGLNACCPVRKTVTKTNWRPKTVTVTKKAVSTLRIAGRVYTDLNLNGKYDAGEPVLSNTKIIVYKLVPQKRRVRAAPAEKKEKLGEFTTKVDGTFIAVVTGTDFGDHIGLADTSRPNVILFRSRVGDDGYLLGRPEIVIVIKPSKTTVVAGPQTTDVPPKPSTTEVTTVTKTLPTNTETKTTETKTIKLTSTTTRTIPTYRITSDGTREKPLCSWGNECAINYGTQSLCAYHLCKSANFTYGVFVNASNDMCVDSATDAVVWMYLVDYREYAEDSFETEGHHTADCWNAELPEGSEVVVSTGFEGAPLCSWNSTCTWLVTAKGLLDLAEPTPLPVKFRDDATKAKCATALCTKAGFESGTFLSASNDMCTESATSDSVFSYIADTETHESGTRDKAAFITAACVPFPLI